jgi:hypothetical protein
LIANWMIGSRLAAMKLADDRSRSCCDASILPCGVIGVRKTG